MGFAPLLGVETNYSGLGAFRNPQNPQPLGGGQNYNYDDGFVRLDATGNAGGHSWNWGYDNAAQFNPVGGGSISMTTSRVLPHQGAKGGEDFALGIEAFAYYKLGELPRLNLGGGPARWGLKASLHYANISIDEWGRVFADVSRVTDTFSMNGVLPPLAPYEGSFSGPGPLLSDNPTRVTAGLPNGASVAGNRELEVDLFGLTIGPVLELPVTNRFSLSLEGGVSLAIANGDFNFSSLTTVAGVGSQAASGGDSRTMLLPGMSGGFSAIIQLTDSWSAYGGARYQYYSDLKIGSENSRAELDFGGAFILSMSASYSF